MFNNLRTLRNRTALFLVPPMDSGRQELIAAQYSNTKVVNWLTESLSASEISQKYINTSPEIELSKIRKVADSNNRTFCFINNEYFLTRFSSDERKEFFLRLRENVIHLNGVVVFFIVDSPNILPSSLILSTWREDNRLFSQRNCNE